MTAFKISKIILLLSVTITLSSNAHATNTTTTSSDTTKVADTDTTDSGRSKEAIRRVVMKRIGGLKYLYNKHMKYDPNLKGKVTVKMVIAPSGSVIRVEMLESSMNNPKFEREVVTRIEQWKFGSVPKGTATVIYPFNFSPDEDEKEDEEQEEEQDDAIFSTAKVKYNNSSGCCCIF